MSARGGHDVGRGGAHAGLIIQLGRSGRAAVRVSFAPAGPPSCSPMMRLVEHCGFPISGFPISCSGSVWWGEDADELARKDACPTEYQTEPLLNSQSA